MGHATGKENVDDALGGAILGRVEFLSGCGFLLEEAGQGEPQSAEHADIEEFAA